MTGIKTAKFISHDLLCRNKNSNLQEHYNFSGMLNSHGCCSLKCRFLSFIVYFIYLLVVGLGLCCCAWAFSSCGPQGLLSGCGAWASRGGSFSCSGAQVPGAGASAVVGCSLNSCGILPPRPRIGRMSPALAGGFLSLFHQGSPTIFF